MTETFTATEIIERNGFAVVSGTTGDFAVIHVEAWIDFAIDYINSKVLRVRRTFSRIPHMTGSTPGSKSASVSDDAYAAILPLMACILRENKKSSLSNSNSTGGSTSASKSVSAQGYSVSASNSVSSAISAASALNNSANTIYRDMYEAAIQALMFEAPNYRQAIV